MNRVLLTVFAVLMLALSGGCSSGDDDAAKRFDPFKGPKPIAVLIESDPWADVLGADTPRVAIYDDGQVVYAKREKGKEVALFGKRLEVEELGAIKQKLASFGDYSKLERFYNLTPFMSDLPTTKIYLGLRDTELVTFVYGVMPPPTDSAEDSGKLPKAVGDLYRYLCSLDFADAKPWEPRYVEVMIWGYDYAPDESIHWPKDWPGLDSPHSIKRGDSYSIFLPWKELPKLQEFLKTRKEKGAVEIDGKKWAAAYRYTFPSEPVWFEAFQRDPE